jgi:hypothetical protein
VGAKTRLNSSNINIPPQRLVIAPTLGIYMPHSHHKDGAVMGARYSLLHVIAYVPPLLVMVLACAACI